ncbi:MAG: hypothetical protein K6G25_05060 [Bacteroidales bacterium]|nr:hypothetical protein [Bacteroidales bacterium]
MKKVFTLISFVAMLAMGVGLRAQEITITLLPGWTWISYPLAEAMDITAAFGDFTPMEGDVIKSQFGFSVYENGQWSGNLHEFSPGLGYHYRSNRNEPVVLSFGATTSPLNVTTADPTEITLMTAICGGSAVSSDGSSILMKGVCWAMHPQPTTNDSYSENGSGPGDFTTEITGLVPNTVYYVRAYAVSVKGISYGEEISFTTLQMTYAISVSSNPTDGGSVDGSGTYQEGTECILTATANEGYFFVNWTENDSVVSTEAAYSFTVNGDRTLVANFDVSGDTAPIGAINGKFTINADGDQVYFSQGNLQYIGSAAEPYWKFAENQWDYLGVTTGQNSNAQDVDRDLFGWGTSGWNTGNTCYQPWDTYNSFGSSYGPKGANNLTGEYANADWGVYNPISNGGNQAGMWRIMTKDEWSYVFNTRTTDSGIRFAKANVNDINGIILLPDDWNAGYYGLSDTNSDTTSYSINTITASEWSSLEQHGAVFLPSAGYRFGTSVKMVGGNGYYWSSIYVNATYAYGLYFQVSGLNPQDCSNRTYGRSVRLVQAVE